MAGYFTHQFNIAGVISAASNRFLSKAAFPPRHLLEGRSQNSQQGTDDVDHPLSLASPGTLATGI